MQHAAGSALPTPRPPLAFTLCSSLTELLAGPQAGTPPCHPLCWRAETTATSSPEVTPDPPAGLRWKAACREPSQLSVHTCCPLLGLPQPLCFPDPGPRSTYCHGLFTCQPSPETANNLKAETVSGSAL